MKKFSRRDFLINSSALVGGLSLSSFGTLAGEMKPEKPNSKFGGVQIGVIDYSWRTMPGSAEDILKYCIEAGVSSIEMGGGVIEEYAGAPSDGEERKAWRMNPPLKKITELRKMFNKAGVKIPLVGFGPCGWRKEHWWSDEETDYAFIAAKAMGAKGVVNEIGRDACGRLGKFAEKHDMFAVYHNHDQPGKPGFSFDELLALSPANKLLFDVGHYFGATGIHPNELIERIPDRVFALHLKDKTGPNSNPRDKNMPWGEGETPLADILKLIRKEKWPIYCDIELEYEYPKSSDAQKEIIKCVQYCKNILT